MAALAIGCDGGGRMPARETQPPHTPAGAVRAFRGRPDRDNVLPCSVRARPPDQPTSSAWSIRCRGRAPDQGGIARRRSSDRAPGRPRQLRDLRELGGVASASVRRRAADRDQDFPARSQRRRRRRWRRRRTSRQIPACPARSLFSPDRAARRGARVRAAQLLAIDVGAVAGMRVDGRVDSVSLAAAAGSSSSCGCSARRRRQLCGADQRVDEAVVSHVRARSRSPARAATRMRAAATPSRMRWRAAARARAARDGAGRASRSRSDSTLAVELRP